MDLGLKGFRGRITDNDLRLLRTFATVVKHGGFAAAESELQIGLPSISRYIKDLEIRLGLRLCERGRRGFNLTAEGKQVHDAAMTLFDSLESFESSIFDIYANPAGAIRLGLVDSLVTDPSFGLADAIKAYGCPYPNVHFSITTKTSNLVEQEVLDGGLDIGIVFERRRMDQLDYQYLYEEVSHLYCTEEHPLWTDHGGHIDDADLSAIDFVGYPFEHGMQKLGLSGAFKHTAIVTHMEAIAMLVNSDRYVGFLPEHYVASLWCGKRFRKLAPETVFFRSKISAISRQGAKSPLVSAFLKQLVPIKAKALHWDTSPDLAMAE